jgi:Tat protein secretion system quality control protein TatD with DNase activity
MADTEEYAWSTGVYDVHCHPTDSMDKMPEVVGQKVQQMLIMSSRFEDIDLVVQATETYGSKVIPAFGYHPWFSHKVYVDKYVDKRTHYKAVLCPEPDDEFLATLPEPLPFEDYLIKMRKYLERFPNALVGELGIDKAFRLPYSTHDGVRPKQLSPYKVDMGHQLKILEMQLHIAVEYGRRVSLHGVQAHNSLFEALRRIPPVKLCLHSYSGSAQFLQTNWFKDKVLRDRVFVSCSVLINATTEERACKLLEGVPKDRILTESDFHAAGAEADSLNMQSLTVIATVYGWTLVEAAQNIKRNFEAFLT